MKKYFLTMAAMALFAVGFTASDDDESSSGSSSSSSTSVEQKQETEAERKARKIDAMMKEAFEYGKQQAVQYTYYQECRIHYQAFYKTPETDEEIALYKRYKAEYDKGWEEGRRIKAAMEN